MADPARATRAAVPVTVRIESIFSGRVALDPANLSRLAAGTHSITFNYAGTNLSVPERIRFRYRLDGADGGWSEEAALRQVVFTNLGPGSYRFRILASDALGSWNGPETSIPFTVMPAFWQTWWFRLVCLLSACLLFFGLYRLRMTRLTQQLNLRFNDRLAERTRIAQELHDTLLQGVLSATMQLDVAEDRTPDDSPTKALLRRVLELMTQVTEEGRAALRGLRSTESFSMSLETSLSRVGQEFGGEDNVNYRVASQAASRSLRPMIRDEVYRIVREAVINAFLHARAQNINVEVEYATRVFRVSVRDDGRGMEPHVLIAGREGHWGLTGMRERAESIGASLKLKSRTGAGTEVELTVPGAIAYGGQPRKGILAWLKWLKRGESKSKRPASQQRGDS